MIQRVVSLAVVLVILVGGGVYAFRKLAPEPAEEAEGPRYATAAVERGDITVGVTATGTLNPTEGGAIFVPWPTGPIYGEFPRTFTVTEVLVREGELVRRGQPLVKLSSGQLQTQLTNLADQIKGKQLELEQKQKNLAQKLGVSVDELSRINPAQGVVLRAPIAGRVVNLEAAEGKEIEQGALVARVVDDSEWALTATLTPGEFGRVRKGQRVVVRFPEFAGLVEARVAEVNANPMPQPTKELLDCRDVEDDEAQGTQFVYRVRIQGKNPGLIVAGMQGEIGLPPADAPEGSAPEAWAERIYWLRYCGKVEGYGSEERVLSTVNGIVTQVHVDDMEVIEAGAPIVSIAGDETQLSIENDLQSIERTREEINNLQMQLASLRAFSDQLTVTAPMDGIVAELRAEVGQEIEIGHPMGNIYNPQRMEMWVQVDDVDVLRVRQDAPVEIRLAALPGEVLQGWVRHISTSGRGEGGITFFQVRIEVEGNDQLRPGMQAEAYIKAGEAKDVLLIPLEAIFQEERQYKVEVLEDDGTTRVVPIEVGLMNDFFAEVKSGLEEGQLVITGSSGDVLPSGVEPSDTLLPGAGR